MSPNPGIAAAHKLALMGYRFTLQGENILVDYQASGEPDPDQVMPLLDLLREHKDEVLFFLRCYCPRCGGMMFIPDLEGQDLCAACDWHLLIELYPGLKNEC
jgi:hypothetical protein